MAAGSQPLGTLDAWWIFLLGTLGPSHRKTGEACLLRLLRRKDGVGWLTASVAGFSVRRHWARGSMDGAGPVSSRMWAPACACYAPAPHSLGAAQGTHSPTRRRLQAVLAPTFPALLNTAQLLIRTPALARTAGAALLAELFCEFSSAERCQEVRACMLASAV